MEAIKLRTKTSHIRLVGRLFSYHTARTAHSAIVDLVNHSYASRYADEKSYFQLSSFIA